MRRSGRVQGCQANDYFNDDDDDIFVALNLKFLEVTVA
jgi:hypothetical protein